MQSIVSDQKLGTKNKARCQTLIENSFAIIKAYEFLCYSEVEIVGLKECLVLVFFNIIFIY